ncbi:MAG: hypothetical protein HZR80_03645 [Candidatus Heimdallarchaeota archaeon]
MEACYKFYKFFRNIRLINYNAFILEQLKGGIFLNREEEIIILTEKTLDKIKFDYSNLRTEFQYLEAIERINGKKFTLDNYTEALIFSKF